MQDEPSERQDAGQPRDRRHPDAISTAYDSEAHPDADVFDPIAWFEGTGDDLGRPPGYLEDFNRRLEKNLAMYAARAETVDTHTADIGVGPARDPEGGLRIVCDQPDYSDVEPPVLGDGGTEDLDIDDTEISGAYLLVQRTDDALRLGPSMKRFADLMKTEMDANPPPGYVSSTVELVEDEEEPE